MIQQPQVSRRGLPGWGIHTNIRLLLEGHDGWKSTETGLQIQWQPEETPSRSPRVTYCSTGTYKLNALLRGLRREEGAKCRDVFGEQTLLLQLTSLAIPAAALETHTVLLVPWKLFRLLRPPLSLIPSPELRSCPTLALTQCWAYNSWRDVSQPKFPTRLRNQQADWYESHSYGNSTLYFGISKKKKKKSCFFRTPTLPSPAQSLLPHTPFSTEQHDTLLHTSTRSHRCLSSANQWFNITFNPLILFCLWLKAIMLGQWGERSGFRDSRAAQEQHRS